ncbi:class I adenylate-forming enzyme family protein [Nonomuraea sp. NPDC050663]|uniref:class I adenylate-forming enzyme family protein n=1 Tax=Nonomuraea sp. NPDC050663 TaxID=3364370 RepID=UPI00379B1CC0
MSTTTRLLAARAAENPDGLALVLHGVGELTHGRWQDRALAAARGLVARGLRPGERVGLRYGGAGWLDYAVAFLAVHHAGGVAVPLPAHLREAELSRLLGDCGATALLHDDDGLRSLGPLRWRASLAELDGADADLPSPPSPADLAQILYTSGTTGRPKGVAATHANLAWGRGGRRRPFAHSRHLVHAFPIGTNAGQIMLMNALDAHPAVVTLPAFTPVRFARLIEDHAAGTVFVVPAMAVELLDSGAHRRFDLSSVLLLGSAAAPLPEAVCARLATALPRATITNYYTSTEAAPAQTVMMYDPARPGSVGRAVAGGQVRIATADGEPLPVGETGEVWLRSPAVPRTYYGDPESTRGVFRDGWIRMGDLGRMDADGYLYLVDRAGDVVKSGGFKVSTLHVEEAVYQHADIVEAAVVGVPHPVLGTQLAAAVVLRAPLPPEDLRAFLAGRLAPHELPARVVELERLPRNAGGKVDKHALRRRLG